MTVLIFHMAIRRCVFHLEPVPFSESDAQGCYRVFQKEVQTKEGLVRSEDKGEFVGNFWDRRRAIARIEKLAKEYDESAIFE